MCASQLPFGPLAARVTVSDARVAPELRRSPFEIVVTASSLGGRRALGELLAPIPPDFPAPIVIAQHLPARPASYVTEILSQRTQLPVRWAADGTSLSPGTVYVARPGRHLLLTPRRTFALSDAPCVNFTRPAADPLFWYAAATYGARALGIVLTGRLHDGAAGARHIRRAGGVVIAQHPATCAAPGMPRAAIRENAVNFVLPLQRDDRGEMTPRSGWHACRRECTPRVLYCGDRWSARCADRCRSRLATADVLLFRLRPDVPCGAIHQSGLSTG